MITGAGSDVSATFCSAALSLCKYMIHMIIKQNEKYNTDYLLSAASAP